MKSIYGYVIGCFMVLANNLHAQSISLDKSNTEPVNVYMIVEKLMGKQAVKVIPP